MNSLSVSNTSFAAESGFPARSSRAWYAALNPALALTLLAASTGAGAAATAASPAPTPPPAPPPIASVPVIPQASTFGEVFTLGKPLVHLRLRYENADDDTRIEDADALSLRTALGFRTASYHGLFALAELESVLALGDYDDGGTNRGMAPRYSPIVDPEGAELNQAYVGIDALPKTVIQIGRQSILDREAPFHRYLGNVLWRQNWQTHDAVAVTNGSLPDTVLRFWYTWNVNRIYGEDHPLRGFDDKGLDGYLMNAVYTGLPLGKIEAYAYLLDYDRSSVPAIRSFYPSTQTYGLRFDGKYALDRKLDLLYIAEVAHQGDFADNPTGEIDQFFLWGSLGLTYKPGGIVQALTAKLSHEHLGGDGGADRFTTPLATLHAFQGWADRFLNTPGDGIEDTYTTLLATIAGVNFMLDYHWFDADHDDYDYGEELDVMATKTFATRYTAGIKYAAYSADGNALNRARNTASGQAADLDRFWVWLEYRY